MKSLALGFAALILAAPAARAQDIPPDPFQWLEDIESPRAMAWVEGQNARTADRLEKDPRYETFRQEALGIFTAADRIPAPRFRAGGIDNFWQDKAHVHGVWRHASAASYRTATPAWTTTLDLDALSKAEGRNWIWKGAICLRPTQTLCLVRLSDGGSDAVEVREYDTAARRFLAGGFRFGNGKQNLDWVDKDTLVVDREWTPGEVTKSGYAYVVKFVPRLGAPKEVFRGQKSDVSAQGIVLHGARGKADGVLVRRSVTFFENEFYLLGEGKPQLIALPKKAEFEDYVSGQAVFALKAPWRGFKAGDLISFDLAGLKAGKAKPVLVFSPGPRQAIQEVQATKDRLVVDLLEDVKGAVETYSYRAGRWSGHRLALPKDANLTLVATDQASDALFVDSEAFLDPTALWLANAAAGPPEKVKQLPARFDASKDLVEQYWATSSDGTRIPYFVVRPREARLDGSTPTLMYGYGGFELAKPPVYLPEMGKIWLERGGAYVIANIRGGGEFGPAWHEAVLREKRQLAFDDFAAVARDMFRRGLTSPRRLGIYGRSNGGVLTTVSMTSTRNSGTRWWWRARSSTCCATATSRPAPRGSANTAIRTWLPTAPSLRTTRATRT